MTTQSPAVVGSAVLDAATLKRVAFIIGASFVLGCLVLAAGIWFALDHAESRLASALDRHANAVQGAGAAIAHAEITIAQPVPIQQPVTIRGPNQDGSMPVKATVGK